MLRFALMFLVLAVVSLALGANGVAGLSMEIARILVVAFLVLSLVSGIFYIITGRAPRVLP
jgi:uncharacterized membrane protein YtjA (UPF0391 family)